MPMHEGDLVVFVAARDTVAQKAVHLGLSEFRQHRQRPVISSADITPLL